MPFYFVIEQKMETHSFLYIFCLIQSDTCKIVLWIQPDFRVFYKKNNFFYYQIVLWIQTDFRVLSQNFKSTYDIHYQIIIDNNKQPLESKVWARWYIQHSA